MTGTDETTLYCGGLPLAGDREITGDERARLVKHVRTERWLACLTLMVMVLGWAAWIAVGLTVGQRSATANSAFIFFSVIPILGSLVPIWIATDHWLNARRIRRDLRGGRVYRFSTRQGHERKEDPPADPADLAVAEFLVDDWYDVLLPSGYVIVYNGLPMQVLHRAPLSHLAPAPAFAAIAAEWTQPVPETVLRANTRPLSASERKELSRFLLNLARRRILPTVFWVGLFTAEAIAGAPVGALCLAGVVAVGTGMSDRRHIALACKMVMDYRTAHLLIIRPSMEAVEREGNPEASDVPDVPIECLLHSRLPWSRGGIPSAWRHVKDG